MTPEDPESAPSVPCSPGVERARGVLSRGATGTEYVLAREVLRQTERLAAVAALCADRERKWNAGEVAIVTVWDLRAALGGTNA